VDDRRDLLVPADLVEEGAEPGGDDEPGGRRRRIGRADPALAGGAVEVRDDGVGGGAVLGGGARAGGQTDQPAPRSTSAM
jgi:hypothetical protein